MSAVRGLVSRVGVSAVPRTGETRAPGGCRGGGTDERDDAQDADEDREKWPGTHLSDVGMPRAATDPPFGAIDAAAGRS